MNRDEMVLILAAVGFVVGIGLIVASRDQVTERARSRRV
ncbi:MAG: hypothetical protein QOE00_743, partial [Ilumatobacteraceae bacterium]